MPPKNDDKSKDQKELSNEDWISAQRKESEHRKWLLWRIRGAGGWVIAALWLFFDGIEKLEKFKIWMSK